MPSLPAARPRALRCALLLVLAAGPALAAPAEPDALAQNLIRLRGEVEQLNGELELLREEQRTTLAALGAQRAELDATLQRQQLAAREARQKLLAQQEASASSGVAGEALKPVLLAAVDALAAQIRAGLPFKTEERLAELESFRAQLGNGTLPPARAANRLWAFFEDEFRLTRENALQSQTIALPEGRVQADVARLGAMALYFQTRDGRVGQALAEGTQWRFVLIQDERQQQQVQALFDALRKQIRQGWFELPQLAGGAR
jgi:hypothetical protein